MPRNRSPRSRSLPVFRDVSSEPLEPRTLLAVGPATLVKDIETATVSSVPGSIVAVGGVTLFRANDGVHGNEWFRTDGTAAGTTLLKDINPGEAGSTLVPTPQGDVPLTAVVGDTLYFSALDATNGAELWKTDGTEAGTVLVKDIQPGTVRSTPTHLTAVGGAVYFIADDGVHGLELWKSDGTPDGTVMVADLAEGTATSRPVPLGAAGGRLVFAADVTDPGATTPGRELWVTDGTAAGTTLLKNIHPSGTSNPGLTGVSTLFPGVETVSAGGALYFAATDPEKGRELWKTDGTPAGTVRVADSNAGTLSTNPTDLTVVGDTVYFTGRFGAGFENALYRTVPTGGAIYMQTLNSFGVHSTGNVGGTFYILTQPAGNSPPGLYRHSPAEPGGLTLVRPLAQVPTAKGQIHDAGGAALFLAPGPAPETAAVWRSNGTAAGTVALATYPEQFHTGVGSERWKLRVGAGGVYYYSVSDRQTGIEPYRTDGTAAGTGQLVDLNQDTQPGVQGGVAYVNGPAGGRTLFTAKGELWSTDGTEAGTALLKDIWPGEEEPGVGSWFVNGQHIHFSPEINGRVYFVGRHPATSIELWSTDGTTAGTRLVKDLSPGENASVIGQVMPMGGRAFFFYNFQDLYVTDGTEAGTTVAVDFDNFVFAQKALVVGDAMYVFSRRLDGGGSELWKTDGTTAGTERLALVAPGVDVFGENTPVAALANRIYFVAHRSGDQPTLWTSDGTSAGTAPVAVLPASSGTLSQMTAVNGRVLFEAGVEGSTDPAQTALWVVDAAGARPLASDVPAVAALTKITGMMSAGNVAYFFAQPPGSTGFELWRTDGTAAGTARLRGPSSIVRSLNVVDGVFYFSVSDAASGRELWRSDGTEAGTSLVQDIRPGTGSSEPGDLAAAGDRIYFHADDGTHGHELWSMPRGAPATTVTGRHVFYNNSAFDGRDPAATAADLAAVATDKAALRPGEVSSFSNVTSYDKGINGVLVEFAGAPPAALSADDFAFQTGRDGDPGAWAAATAPASVVLLPSPVGAVTRYAITWPDGAIANTWLRVTVKASERTGLASPDVFTFGNLVGETGPGAAGGTAGQTQTVTAQDLWALRRRKATGVPVDSLADINRDGALNALDVVAVRRNLLRNLPPVGGPVITAAATVPVTRVASRGAPAVRSVFSELVAGAAGGDDELLPSA